MPEMQKVLARSRGGRGFLKIPHVSGSTTLGGIQHRLRKSLSAVVAQSTVIRYAYYVFVFALPFEGAIGGLSRLGLLLAGLTSFQPRLFLKSPPKAFWCFVVYLFVVAGLGLFTVLDAQQDTEFPSEFITQLFRLSPVVSVFLDRLQIDDRLNPLRKRSFIDIRLCLRAIGRSTTLWSYKLKKVR